MTKDLPLAIDRPVVLVGMMAAGKSRLGRDLAQALGLDFIDTDALIEEEAGMTIGGIFAAEGQQGFRDREARIIAIVLGEDAGPCVVSTGGGAILRPENAALIFGDTISVWVKASIETLVARTRSAPTVRCCKTPIMQKYSVIWPKSVIRFTSGPALQSTPTMLRRK